MTPILFADVDNQLHSVADIEFAQQVRGRKFRLTLRDGTIVNAAERDIEGLLTTIIANANTALELVQLMGGEDQTWFDSAPIIAWRIYSCGMNQPIAAGGATEAQGVRWAIHDTSTGKVIADEVVFEGSLDDWKARTLRDHQHSETIRAKRAAA